MILRGKLSLYIMDWFDLGFPPNETFREKMQIFSQNFAFFLENK